MTQNGSTTASLNIYRPAHTYSCQALVTYISSNCRPPKGMAGYIDWVMDGHISNLVLNGKVKGSFCESLLLITGSKIKAPLSVIIGTGDPIKIDTKRIGLLGDFTGRVLNDLKVSHFGIYTHDLFLPGFDPFRILDTLIEGLICKIPKPARICILTNTQEQKDIAVSWLQQQKT
ncbi:hypothetical protein JXL19_00430 [bacterium]|nr:hypothetical protein [bacterium]